MLNIETTRDYLKYTLTLAGLGFAYAATTLAGKDALFGFQTVALGGVEIAFARWLVGLLLALFFLSTLFGVFAISGTVRYENEMAALPAPAAGAAAPAPTPAATKALAATRKYANRHLKALIAAFLGAAVFFVEGFLSAGAPAQRCLLRSPGAGAGAGIEIEFDCAAAVAAAVAAQGGSVKP